MHVFVLDGPTCQLGLCGLKIPQVKGHRGSNTKTQFLFITQ